MIKGFYKKITNNNKQKWFKSKYFTPTEYIGKTVRTLENNMSCKVGVIGTVTRCSDQSPYDKIGKYVLHLDSGWSIYSNNVEVLLCEDELK